MLETYIDQCDPQKAAQGLINRGFAKHAQQLEQWAAAHHQANYQHVYVGQLQDKTVKKDIIKQTPKSFVYARLRKCHQTTR